MPSSKQPATDISHTLLVYGDFHVGNVGKSPFQYDTGDVLTHWSNGHHHGWTRRDPKISTRTNSEINVDHDQIKRLDFQGGKALWKFENRKKGRQRAWVPFKYDNVKKEFIVVHKNASVVIRGEAVKAYEMYLARLVME